MRFQTFKMSWPVEMSNEMTLNMRYCTEICTAPLPNAFVDGGTLESRPDSSALRSASSVKASRPGQIFALSYPDDTSCARAESTSKPRSKGRRIANHGLRNASHKEMVSLEEVPCLAAGYLYVAKYFHLFYSGRVKSRRTVNK